MENSSKQPVVFSELQPGDIIVAEEDFFTCMEGGDKVVTKNEPNSLYVKCDSGDHYLDGQIDHNTGHLCGFSKKVMGESK